MHVEVVGYSPLGVTMRFRHEKLSGIINFWFFTVRFS